MWGAEVLLMTMLVATPKFATVKSSAQLAPITGESCAYWEWAAGKEEDGVWSYVASSRHSRESVALRVDGQRVEVPIPQLRLYLKPTKVVQVTSLDALPERAKKDGVRADELPLTLAEFCLAPARRYHVRRETKGKTEIYHLSDRPFDTKRPATPYYASWTH
ncbi:MAG: hypothetical protein RMA76_15630 [Deltaproteobacteria bacterium]|jgi:hypothetical protein